MANSTNKKEETHKVVNYVLMMLAIILIVFIATKLYNIYQDNKLSSSVLSRTIGSIQYTEVDNSIREMASDGFILISYTKDKSVKNFETALKKDIISNNLQSNFYYLDVTDLMQEEGYIATLNNKFNLTGSQKIIELPAILYYKDGTHMKTISSTDNQMITADEFKRLLDSYEIIE